MDGALRDGRSRRSDARSGAASCRRHAERVLSVAGYVQRPHAPTPRPLRKPQGERMFLFFSNKLGWVRSILVSVIGTVLLLLLLSFIV